MSCDAQPWGELALRTRAIADWLCYPGRQSPPGQSRRPPTRPTHRPRTPQGFVKPVQGTFGGTATAAPTANTPLFGVFNAGHFSLFHRRLRTNSLAKILAEPNLVALDGQPARFLVGGMFPFPVPQSSSIPGGTAVVTVQFQRFGVILTFLPEILANDVIRLDVEPVISRAQLR